MTAEVAILNREAIALAADSAATWEHGEGAKIFTSAQKIFSLSRYAPVAVMLYQGTALLKVPWETIIKIYRHHLAQKTFRSLDEYAEHFLNFLETSDRLFDAEYERYYLRTWAHHLMRMAYKRVGRRVEEVLKQKGPITERQIRALTTSVLKGFRKDCMGIPLHSRAPRNYVSKLKPLGEPVIGEAIDHVFGSWPLTKSARSYLISSFYRGVASERLLGAYYTGLVFAGFGDDDVFPQLVSYQVDGRAGGVLGCVLAQRSDIGLDNGSAIFSFAQGEWVHAFMEGVMKDYQEAVERDFGALLSRYHDFVIGSLGGLSQKQAKALRTQLSRTGKALLRRYWRELAEYRAQTYTWPIVEVTAVLPKSDLAEMAETLVSLTRFRQRVSKEEETVGGPIDVALISKGDGLVWIKRKHYFEPELNPQFLANYYRG